MYCRPHGGFCCGIAHLTNFTGSETVAGITEMIGPYIRGEKSMLVEVVLTNQQITTGKRRYHNDLAANLKEAGFRLVSRFVNPNSGNICNVFHYTKALKSLVVSRPFKWNPN